MHPPDPSPDPSSAGLSTGGSDVEKRLGRVLSTAPPTSSQQASSSAPTSIGPAASTPSSDSLLPPSLMHAKPEQSLAVIQSSTATSDMAASVARSNADILGRISAIHAEIMSALADEETAKKDHDDALRAEAESVAASEEVEARYIRALTARIEALKSEMTELSDAEGVLEKGSSDPIILPASVPYVIADNRYRSYLNRTTEEHHALEPRCIRGAFRHIADLKGLPSELRQPWLNHHGLLFTDNRLIPRPTYRHIVLVVQADEVESVSARIQHYSLEVFTHCRHGTGICYGGTFTTALVWHIFCDVVTGDIPELRNACSHENNCPLSDLRDNWRTGHSDLCFCILDYTGFNEEFFNQVENISLSALKDPSSGV